MATPYEDIYSLFRVNKIKDIDTISLTDAEIEEIDFGYLKSARGKFKACAKLINYDDTLKQFNDTLTDEEIEILLILMVIEWITPKINATELLRINMDSSDFRIFSPANQLKELRELRENYKKEASGLISKYSFGNFK